MEDKSKTKRQFEVLKKWAKAGGKGTLEAATGFGKTRTALMLSERAQERWGYHIHLLIVVPSEYLYNQWHERLRGYGIDCSYEVVIINTLIKHRYKCKILILDEIHEYTGQRFREVFIRVKYERVLGLTATLDPDDPKEAILRKHCPVIDKIPLKECLENGWVSTFQVINVGLEMGNEDQGRLLGYNRRFNEAFKVFGHDFNLAMSCLSDQEAATKHANFMGWMKDGAPNYGAIMGVAKKFNDSMQGRKYLLYNTSAKVEAVVDIVRANPGKRIIVFSQSISMCETIKDTLNDEFPKCCVSYHSEVKGAKIKKKGEELRKAKKKRLKLTKRIGAKKVRQRRIEAFIKEGNSVNVISSATALDRGADLPFIDMAIVTSGSSKFRQAVQRLGRAIRFVEGKHTIMIELYIADSQDYKWLKQRQKEIPRDTINWVDSLNEAGVLW